MKDRAADHASQRIPGSALGHAAGDHAVAGAQGARGWLCAKFYRTPQAQRAGADQRDPGSGGEGVSTRKIEAVLEDSASRAYRQDK